MRIYISIILIFLLVVPPAFGTIRYSDWVNGNDSTGNGSFGAPYKTIVKLVSVSTSGDILLLRGGENHIYDETISITGSSLSSKNGTPSAYTIIAAYNNEPVTIKPSGSGVSIFNFGDGTVFPFYWCLSNLIINATNLGDGPSGIKFNSGGSNIIQGLIFTNMPDNSILISWQGGTDFNKVPHFYTLRSNQFYNTGFAWQPGFNFPHDVYFQGRDSLIEYHRHWYVGATDVNAEASAVKFGSGSSGRWISNNVFRFSYISNTIRGIEWLGPYNKAYRNIFVNPRVHAAYLGYQSSSNNLFAYNTVDGGIWPVYTTSVTDGSGRDSQIIGNVILNFTQKGIVARGSGGMTLYASNNVVYSAFAPDANDIVGEGGGIVVESNNIKGTGPDAQLSGQFREPGSGGSGRNVGLDLPSLPNQDFDGDAISEGTPDAGAQEFSAGGQLPLITVEATDNVATEAGTTTATFTVTRTGSTTGNLTVLFSLAGSSATSGDDYNSIGTSVVINDGSATATITVTPINDSAQEGDENLVLTVSTDAAYTVGNPNQATILIVDDDVNRPSSPATAIPAIGRGR